MLLIKLDATPSTNEYLKELSGREDVPDFTVVSAEYQTAGRGQMGAKWESVKGENLMFSVLVRNAVPNQSDIFTLNAAVALSVATVLENLSVPDIAIKWPNDILSGNRKLSGILIENVWGSDGVTSIIGIGVNVNQQQFEGLPNASSMHRETAQWFDRESVLTEIVNELQRRISDVVTDGERIWSDYHNKLFRKDRPSAFEDADGGHFMGMIRRVDDAGKLAVELEDESIKLFTIKEIKLLY